MEAAELPALKRTVDAVLLEATRRVHAFVSAALLPAIGDGVDAQTLTVARLDEGDLPHAEEAMFEARLLELLRAGVQDAHDSAPSPSSSASSAPPSPRTPRRCTCQARCRLRRATAAPRWPAPCCRSSTAASHPPAPCRQAV